MQYRKLGNSGIDISVVGLGCWAIGGWAWGGTDEKESIKTIKEAIDLGINLIDTAPIYGFGCSEEIVGKAIKGKRDKVVISTKFGLRWDLEEGEYVFDTEGYKIYRNGRPHSIRTEIERSLKRLQTDYIDLYFSHWPDHTTPYEQTMETLMRLKEEGKIRAIGVSNAGIEIMKRYLSVGPLDANQPLYNLLQREFEKENLGFCRDNQISVTVYSPLAQGLLTGKVTPDRKFQEGDWRANKPWFQPEVISKILSMLEKFKPIAQNHGITLASLAIAWTIAQPGITCALVGARRVEQVRENALAGDVNLTSQEIEAMRLEAEKLNLPPTE